MAESSAYKSSFSSRTPAIWLIYIINSRGPSIDPWGTPQVFSEHEDRVPDTSKSCCRSDSLWLSYDWNHLIMSWLRPRASSFINNILWSTVSSSFCRSNKTIPTKWPLSIWNLIKHNTQESQEVSPLLAGGHTAARNRQDNITKTNTKHK